MLLSHVLTTLLTIVAAQNVDLFSDESLLTYQGTSANWSLFQSKSVILFFGANNCSMTQHFLPTLVDFTSAVGEQVEIVYVSSDNTTTIPLPIQDNWYRIADSAADLFKAHFGIFALWEKGRFTEPRKHGIPSLVFVCPTGNGTVLMTDQEEYNTTTYALTSRWNSLSQDNWFWRV